MKVGPYEIQAQIAAGPDGVAYRAVDPGHGRPVELRVLAPAAGPERLAVARSRRIRIASMIVAEPSRRVLEVREDGDPPFLVVDGASGLPLLEALPRLSRYELEARIDLCACLAGAVAEAHRLGLAHGALTPGAIDLTPGDRPRLDFTGLDLGLGRPARGDFADDIAGLGDVFRLIAGVDVSGGDGTALSDLSSGTCLLEPINAETQGGLRQDLDGLIAAMIAPEAAARPSACEVVERLGQLREKTASKGTGAHATREALAAIGVTRESDRAVDGDPLGSIQSVGYEVDGRGDGSSPSTEPRDRLGRFRVLERIGQGGMGAVYRGEDLADGTIVALKILRPEWASREGSIRRFRKEARMLGELNNPYVTNLLEANEDDGILFLALEYVSGRSLGRLIAEEGPLPESAALSILADVARALVEAHERGIVHRDIKPDNILLLDGDDELPPRAKLSDFGLARHVIESESLRVTQDHAVVGTPHYMSPEQGMGGEVGPRSDVYAMGVTLYQMLTGSLPFEASRLVDLIAMHRGSPPPPLRQACPRASDGACRIVEKALAKAPESRFADASALLDAIDRLLRGEPATESAHPRLPDTGPEDVLRFDFAWDLEAPPRALWPLVTNTERLNQAIGLPPASFRTELEAASGRTRRFGEATQGGLVAEWEEHPYEWVEPRRMGVLREYRRGPFRWMISAVELTPTIGGGTTLTHRIRISPRNLFMRAAANLKVGRDSKRALEQVYRRIDASVTGKLGRGGLADPFLEARPLPPPRRRRLERLLEALSEREIPRPVLEGLGDFLATAPDQEVARIRPMALAKRLGLDPASLLAACLHGAREGLLVMLWDLLCPLCRVPSEVRDTLRSLKDHAHCEACGLDYDLDFARSVEMIFRVHPEIREADLGVYCIGGPAHSPHVVAQVRVDPAERLELELGLSEGTYRLRGPQLPHAHELAVESSRGPRRLEIALKRGPEGRAAASLRSGDQTLVIRNDFDQELVVRLERTASRGDAVTAERASSLALFRELFPGEILSPGQLVSVSATTLLVTRLEDAEALYIDRGDAGAFAALHEHFRLLEGRIRRDGGSMIKSVGEGVLAAFPEAGAAVRAALGIEEVLASGAMTAGLRSRAAVHRGPAMAATINDHLDYFGLTVAQASSLLAVASPGGLILSREVAAEPSVLAILRARGCEAVPVPATLPGTGPTSACRVVPKAGP